jgi:cytoskeletal protein CcmA (bactofilin family)
LTQESHTRKGFCAAIPNLTGVSALAARVGDEEDLMAINGETAFESRIGKGTKISGKLFFKAPARIDGEADGEISGDEIVIAAGAVVTARINATRVSIAGTVSGEIVARERVELLPTARVRCTISTPSLVLSEGAKFDGDCKMPRERIAA